MRRSRSRKKSGILMTMTHNSPMANLERRGLYAILPHVYREKCSA